MDIQQRDDGHWHFQLGPVERWVIIAAAAALVTTTGMIVKSITDQGDSQSLAIHQLSDQVGDMKIQQAVTNAQMSTLNRQLSDVPNLVSQIAEIKVQVSRNAADVRELQQQRERRQ